MSITSTNATCYVSYIESYLVHSSQNQILIHQLINGLICCKNNSSFLYITSLLEKLRGYRILCTFIASLLNLLLCQQLYDRNLIL